MADVRTRAVRFENASGQTLEGRLDTPRDRAVRGVAVFAHCFTCGKDLPGPRAMSRALAAQGVAVLRFDFTGVGQSEGDITATTMATTVDDLVAAARAAERELQPVTLLIGHSFGGVGVLLAAPELPDVRAVVTIATPSDAAHIEQLFEDELGDLSPGEDATIEIAGRSFDLSGRFVDSLRQADLDEACAGLGRALLVLHAPGDAVVGIDHARELYRAAKHPKSFVSLDGADHLLSDKRDARYAAAVVAAWVSRYLPEDGAPGDANGDGADAAAGDAVGDGDDAPERQERRFEVEAVTGVEPYTTRVRTRGHALLADEPKGKGGQDRGPTPADLVAAGLAACTTITLRMYADRKRWPLEEIGVGITRGRVDIEGDQGTRTRTVYTLSLRLEGDLDDEQRARLLEIAGRCPVHRQLVAGAGVEITLES
jgi:uncharacterized OsmC-like protein/pimeloyl-ACP methyl ester carboxylesterase